ncbi:16S rRNA (cytosine(967)-C(5))-methyltransferase RsmB [Luteimonas aestuarii]|uniref:16S rRNA (cytosine(967)-C(5))-methyltransferase n=1 Tax=Luteimonas aestuarii TaxID=453837 RepID=A0A4R5U0X9_9GAMM|nr:16S rRNA (cytosine(967)-C(5))-methyltransferase RsmB [Luteimonas aestuarii]TDK27204.1 16S rRNA (cytosine(967)-C(5))-methyltransferase RsmB [Luteimonas aestuarii]
MAGTSQATGVAARVVAANVLDGVLHHGRSLKAGLGVALPALPDPRDRALVEAICFAALRIRHRADAALAAWIPSPLPKRDAPLRALLLAGFAQLDPLGLPAHAALAATVDAARAMGRAHQAKLVNALLRRAQRDGLPEGDWRDLWPSWLRGRLRSDWPDAVDAIVAGSANQAPTWLRVNRLRGTRDGYRQRLLDAGIAATAPGGFEDALLIEGSLPVAQLPGFGEGDVSVQDGSAQQVADTLALPAGARVLDACAAPGGKAAHLLERDPTLRLVALDVDPARLRKVGDNFARLHVGAQATLHAADAVDADGWWDGEPFDAILLDAPCSATGIIRRQPDVLLHRRERDLDALVLVQASLLDALWPLLRPGGTLAYVTCSILDAENAAQASAFLARTPDAEALPLGEAYGRPAGPGRQRLPGEQACDGFFYTIFRRGVDDARVT